MEPLLVKFYEENFKGQISSLESIKDKCQELISYFEGMKIGKFEKKDFKNLVFSTEGYLFEKIMFEKPLEVVGMKVSKAKLFDLLEKPTGYFELINMAKSLINRIDAKIKTEDVKITPDLFLIRTFEFTGVDFNLKVNDTLIAELKRKNEIYAISDKAQMAYNFAVQYCDLLNKSQVFPKVQKTENRIMLHNFFDTIVDFDITTQKASVRIEGIQFLDVYK